MKNMKTVLVIDDDKQFAFGLKAVLLRAGFKVQMAGSGMEGLQSIQTEKPDLILCDVMMPPPNGLQLKKELAKDPQADQVPFLFLSARSALVDKLDGLENGADDYLTKPFEVSELLARILSVLRRDELGRRRGRQEATAALDGLRSGISANLSHEMRTPLTILLSTLELVVREKFTENNQDLENYLELANRSAYRIKFLIEDLEMLHRIDQGWMNSLRQNIDLQFDLKDPLFKIWKVWESKEIHVQLNIHPGACIEAPRFEFSHVLMHLVDNACKFSPFQGKVSVFVEPNGMGGCILDVMDEGEGIPLDLREKVFERYYQVSQGDTRLYGGLGIGLTLARAFAQSLGGEVQIMDSPQGCCTRLVLPPNNLA